MWPYTVQKFVIENNIISDAWHFLNICTFYEKVHRDLDSEGEDVEL